jgi:tetratricopeptide (TPR) repeat protein
MNRKQRRLGHKGQGDFASPKLAAPMAVQNLFAEACRHHQAGRLSEAERAYRQLLAVNPRQPDALHLLGVVAYQSGRQEAAVDLIGQAIRLRDDVPVYHNNLGIAFGELGRFGEAVTHYKRALTLKPDFVDAHFNLGNALQEQGRPDEAIAHYQRAIAFKPGYAEAHNNLGNGLKQQGKLDESMAHYQRAIDLKPDYAEAHNNLGLALKEQGRLDEAMAHYQRAVALRPGSVDVHNNLGNVLRQQGKLDEAMAHYQRAITLNPDYAEAHNNLGIALKEQDKLDEATLHYQRAVDLKPDFAEAHSNLGSALKAQEKFGEAMVHYQRALALKPDYAEVYHNMGNVFQLHSKYGEAIAHYQRAIALKPNNGETYYNLANALRELGQFDEAQRASERALELAPRNGRYYRQLFDGERVVAGDRRLAAAETLAEDMASLPIEDQKELHFALGKAYEDLGQGEQSFRHRLEGNALKRQEFAYNESEVLGFFDRIRTVFTAELPDNKRGLGNPSMVPTFIVGMPRSGTTLVEQILASHPKVFGAGELAEFSKAMKSLGLLNGALSFPEAVPALSAQQLHQLGTSYLDAVRAEAPRAERITDKMPANFSYVGLIHLALPNARIIHMRRDPVDTCLSCFSLLFAGDLPYCYDLGELGRYYRAYETLMEHWRQVLPAGVILDVRYEAVVADTERQARQILAHCGLEWDDACLAFYKTQRPIRTASMTQVRQPVYRTSVGRWKPYQHLLQPLIKELGIELDEAR